MSRCRVYDVPCLTPDKCAAADACCAGDTDPSWNVAPIRPTVSVDTYANREREVRRMIEEASLRMDAAIRRWPY